MPENRRHREPVRQAADHGSLRRGDHVGEPDLVVAQEVRDDEDDRRDQEHSGRAPLHAPQVPRPLDVVVSADRDGFVHRIPMLPSTAAI